MHTRLTYDQIASRIEAAFPTDACSVEERDHFDKVRVRFYTPGRKELFTSNDIAVVSISEPSLLQHQIEEWQSEYRTRSET